MHSSNPMFLQTVTRQRGAFNALLRAAKSEDFVYPSKHFFERIVERDLSLDDLFFMVAPALREFKTCSHNYRTMRITWKQFKIYAIITLGAVTRKRMLVLKTAFQVEDGKDFDLDIRL